MQGKPMTTVLVVDDNPANLEVLSDCLTDFGYTVLLKKDGDKALALLERRMPDIILLDIVMPGMDGYETCRRLKSMPQAADIPVIFMTALSDISDKIKGFELGAVDYITKPFQHEEVLARVKTHLTLQGLKKDLQKKNRILAETLERERNLMEDLRLNLSISLPHELRTPLSAILGFSSFLTHPDHLPEPMKIAENARSIHQSGLRLHRLIENSLLYANLRLIKYASGRRGWHSRHSVATAKRFIEAAARQKAEAAHRPDDLRMDLSDVTIRISSQNLEKILMEILDNAFKFSSNGTPVQINNTINGNLCIFSISDRGRGMTREQMENIGAYMQFDRLSHEQQGAGLGLIIASLLTRLEGGVLSLDSRPDCGTTVSIVLNCESVMDKMDQEQEETIPARETQPPHPPQIIDYRCLYAGDEDEGGRTLSIFIITPEKSLRIALTDMLSEAGFHVETAGDAYDGLTPAREMLPHVILIDLSVLEEGSPEMIFRLNELRSKGVKVMILTETPPDFNRDYNLQTLCDDMICIPPNVHDVFSKLEVHLGVEWVYSDSNECSSFFVIPPSHELEKLNQLIKLGHVKKIFEQLDAIAGMDAAFIPFVEKLRHFAEGFQMNLLRDLIGRYLNRSEFEKNF
jgi:DNA-binding response OmpR family regulator